MFRLLNLAPFLAINGRFYSTIHYTFKGTVWNPATNPTPPSLSYYGIPMVSIYSSPFLDQLMEHIQAILSHSSHPKPYFNFILEVLLKNGSVKTVGKGFSIASYTDLSKIREMLEGYIENFETQSGTPEERQPEEVLSSLIRVFNRSDAPAVNWKDPLALPYSEKSPAPKARSPKATAEKLAIMNSQMHELSSELKVGFKEMVQAIKNIPTQAPAQTPSLLTGVNWAPIINGFANVLITNLGGQSVPTPTSPVATPASQTPAEAPVVSQDLAQIKELIKTEIAPLVNKVNNFESMLTRLTESQVSTNNQISALTESQTQLTSNLNALAQLMEAQIKASSKNLLCSVCLL